MKPKRNRSRGQRYAKRCIAILAEGPIERGAQIVDTPSVLTGELSGGPRFPLGFGPLQKVSGVLRMSLRDGIEFSA
jgi:hypothetical protein